MCFEGQAVVEATWEEKTVDRGREERRTGEVERQSLWLAVPVGRVGKGGKTHVPVPVALVDSCGGHLQARTRSSFLLRTLWAQRLLRALIRGEYPSFQVNVCSVQTSDECKHAQLRQVG